MNERQPEAEVWMVEAVIQPFKLDAVTRAVDVVEGVSGMTVADVRGFGREEIARAGHHRVAADVEDFVPKVQLQIAVAGAPLADRIVGVIRGAARTGNLGDGTIFAWPLARVVRIVTGEEGCDAL